MHPLLNETPPSNEKDGYLRDTPFACIFLLEIGSTDRGKILKVFLQLIMNSVQCKVSTLFLSQKYMSDIKFPFGKEKRF